MPASFAQALAKVVFPVPGGPYNKTPLRILAPLYLNLSGLIINSNTSLSAILAESRPTISLNLTLC